MNRKLVLLVPLLIAVGAASTVFGDSSYPPPPNVRITYIPQLNNEEQVFICPTDSNIIIANWRDFRLGFRQIGIGRSTDGGQTWVDSLIPFNMQYFYLDAQQSDPTMTVDRLGNFYMSALDWDASGLTGGSVISFYKSTDKGVSWTGPVPNVSVLGDFFEDKQFITTDRTGGPHDGNLYCSWTRFPNPDRIAFVRSTDGGASFEDTVIVGPSQTSTGCGSYVVDAGQFSIPIVSSNGDVHVFWQGTVLDSGGTCTGHTALKHVMSSDGGQSFSYEDTLLTVSGYSDASGGIATYSQPAGDADITGGPFDGNIYISFTNIGPEDGDRSDVDFVRSTDNGLTWSPRLQINDDANSGEIDNFHPWLIVNQEGVIITIFYDQRYDAPTYHLFDMLAAYSFDGGLTFTSNHRISSVSSSPGFLGKSGSMQVWKENADGTMTPLYMDPMAGRIGEYIGVTAYHDKINAVWTDSRDGNSEVYTANWYLPILEPRLLEPPDGSVQGPSALFEWATAWKHDQDRYRMELSMDPDLQTGVQTFVADTPFVPKDTITAEGSHYWRVKALATDGTDSSEYSETWSFIVDIFEPGAFDLLLPEDGKVTNNPTPFFDWEDATDISTVTYDLEISTDSTFPAGPSTRVYADLEPSELTPPDTLVDSAVSYWRVIACDAIGHERTSSTSEVTYIPFTCGDVDGSGGIANVADITYLVDYLFNYGPPPPIEAAANADGDNGVNVADLTYLVAYIFQYGPEPIC